MEDRRKTYVDRITHAEMNSDAIARFAAAASRYIGAPVTTVSVDVLADHYDMRASSVIAAKEVRHDV